MYNNLEYNKNRIIHYPHNIQQKKPSFCSMSKPLNPLKQPKRKLKQSKQKQQNWVLDCMNEQKSKLQPYSSIKDKYLKYFVVRVPKKKKYFHTRHPTSDKEEQVVDGEQFRSFLSKKKEMVLGSQIGLRSYGDTERQNVGKGYSSSYECAQKRETQKEQNKESRQQKQRQPKQSDKQNRENGVKQEKSKQKKEMEQKVKQKCLVDSSTSHRNNKEIKQNESRKQKILTQKANGTQNEIIYHEDICEENA